MKPLFPLVVASVLLQPQGEDPLRARTKGRADAPVTVYEMADFQCPACRLFAVTVLPALDSEYVRTGKVRWVFINLPLTSIHPNAVAAAEASSPSRATSSLRLPSAPAWTEGSWSPA